MRAASRVLAAHDLHEHLLQLGLGDLEARRPPRPPRAAARARPRRAPRPATGMRHQPSASRDGAAPRARAAASQPASFTRSTRSENAASRSRGRVERHDAPVLHHRDARAELLRLLEVVRGEHDGVARRRSAPRTKLHSVWRSSTSTPAVGSSSTITGGRCTSACATITRRFMPPESAAHVGVAPWR